MLKAPSANGRLAPPMLRRTTSIRRPGILVHPQSTENYQWAINALSGSDGVEQSRRLAQILEEGIKYAIMRGNAELLTWMMRLGGDAGNVLQSIVHDVVDEDGYGIVSISIIASASTVRDEKEDLVRRIVRKWGLPSRSLPPHAASDPSNESRTTTGIKSQASWTALHLASLLSTSPLISFLLTQGASPFVTTARGLTPLDLIADMPHREDIAVLLQHAMDAADEEQGGMASAGLNERLGPWPCGDAVSLSDGTNGGENQHGSTLVAAASMQRYRANKVRAVQVEHRRNRKRSERDAQDAFIVEKMKGCLELGKSQGVGYLLHSYQEDVRRASEPISVEDEMALEDEEAEEDGVAGLHSGSDDGLLGRDEGGSSYGQDDLNSSDIDDASFLAWPLDKLDAFLNIVITSYRPQRFPLGKRTLPANALYLFGRFAVLRGGQGWLNTILEQATMAIERVCMANAQDVFTMTFWIYNVTILLYLVETDPVVEEACHEADSKVVLREMIIALQIHIMRFAEERIDRIMEAALLDFEPSDQSADVQFTDEWTFLRGLTGKAKKRATNPHVASLFGNPESSTTPPRGAPSEAGSPMTRDLSIRSSLMNLRADVAASPSASIRSLAAVVGVGAEPAPTPLAIVDILYGTHLVLQLYQVNPALIIQIFSQIMLWISSEVFNRILAGGKKLLCRSKAAHIKQNLAVLEEWVRQSGLPPSIYTKHFERCLQLLDWLQCSSQLKEMDMLIAATQHLKALNPLQLRKALKDYRYELNEPRMSEDCVQYLEQLQRDWKKQRVDRGVETIRRQFEAKRTGRASAEIDLDELDQDALVASMVDSLFDPDLTMADYTPRTAPDSLGEMQDSRYMLPIDLPSTEFLPAIPHANTDWDAPLPNPFSCSIPSRPSSQTSLPSRLSVPFKIVTDEKLKRFPDDFLNQLEQADRMADTRRWISLANKADAAGPSNSPVPQAAMPTSSRSENTILVDSSAHNAPWTPSALDPSAGISEPVSPSPLSGSRRYSKPMSPM